MIIMPACFGLANYYAVALFNERSPCAPRCCRRCRHRAGIRLHNQLQRQFVRQGASDAGR